MTVTAPPSPPRTTLFAPKPPEERAGAGNGDRGGGERRRSLSLLRATDVYALVGAAAAALASTGLMFNWLLPFNGAVGFVAVAYGLFLCLYALLVSFDEDGPAVRDRLAAVIHNAGVFSGPGILPVNVVALYVLTAVTTSASTMRSWRPSRASPAWSSSSRPDSVSLGRAPPRTARR